MDYVEKARRVISLEIDELKLLIEQVDSSFSCAVDLLKNCVESHGKILGVRVVRSGNIGSKLAATLSSTGAPATLLNCQDALHGDLGLVNTGDCVLALSYSGETDELLSLLPHLKRRGAKIIAITGKPDSTLGSSSDCCINVKVSREACPLNLAPTSSTTNTLVIGDAIAMVLLEARGFTRDHFAELHPGGALGRSLLLRASDIMRSGNDIVIVPGSESIRSIIDKMTSARAGAVVITCDQGKLVGVFTQGDFARAFQTGDGDIGSKQVAEFMTEAPIHVNEDRLVGEVLKLLEDHRIDDLVVVNSSDQPIGMIDTQDLTRLQVV